MLLITSQRAAAKQIHNIPTARLITNVHNVATHEGKRKPGYEVMYCRQQKAPFQMWISLYHVMNYAGTPCCTTRCLVTTLRLSLWVRHRIHTITCSQVIGFTSNWRVWSLTRESSNLGTCIWTPHLCTLHIVYPSWLHCKNYNVPQGKRNQLST